MCHALQLQDVHMASVSMLTQNEPAAPRAVPTTRHVRLGCSCNALWGERACSSCRMRSRKASCIVTKPCSRSSAVAVTVCEKAGTISPDGSGNMAVLISRWSRSPPT